jgi:hypothetical protein
VRASTWRAGADPERVGLNPIRDIQVLCPSLTITGAGEIPDSHRWDSSLKIRFARDSPLEGVLELEYGLWKIDDGQHADKLIQRMTGLFYRNT